MCDREIGSGRGKVHRLSGECHALLRRDAWGTRFDYPKGDAQRRSEDIRFNGRPRLPWGRWASSVPQKCLDAEYTEVDSHDDPGEIREGRIQAPSGRAD